MTKDGFVTPGGARNPGTNPGLGYFRFRSPLLTESMSLSFPAGNEMFQFPAFALLTLCVQVRVTEGCSAGFPHSDISGSTLVCQFPGAFRRLPRLSSPLDAKTSTMHPSELDHNYRSPSRDLWVVRCVLFVVCCWLCVAGCPFETTFNPPPTTHHLQPTTHYLQTLYGFMTPGTEKPEQRKLGPDSLPRTRFNRVHIYTIVKR